jgi:hypothetical protein
MRKIAIIVVVILALAVVGMVFAAQRSSLKPETDLGENEGIAGSDGRHLTLELREDVGVQGNP